MYGKLSLTILLFATFLISYTECRYFSDHFDSFKYYQDNNVEPPPHTDHAKTARYVVHKSEWASMGTLSTLKQIHGFPMVNIISVADSGKDEKSTGVIYFYLTDLDYTAQDLRKDNRLTVLFSNDQDLACTNGGLDPMEPTCARIMITGKAIEMEENTTEYEFGKSAFISRHPAAVNWLKTHDFFLCKLEIQQIAVLNWYGGPHYVTSEDYYKADIETYSFDFNKHQIIEHVNDKEDNSIENVIRLSSNNKEIRIKINKNTNIDVINIEI